MLAHAADQLRVSCLKKRTAESGVLRGRHFNNLWCELRGAFWNERRQLGFGSHTAANILCLPSKTPRPSTTIRDAFSSFASAPSCSVSYFSPAAAFFDVQLVEGRVRSSPSAGACIVVTTSAHSSLAYKRSRMYSRQAPRPH